MRERASWTVAVLFGLSAALVAWIGANALYVALGVMGTLLYTLATHGLAKARSAARDQVQEDRVRIARELHDGVGQWLTAAKLQLVVLRRREPGHGKELDRLVACLDRAVDELRRSTTALAPRAVVELGLRDALKQHCRIFSEATRLPVRFEVPFPVPSLSVATAATCYRIAQEALHNAARHAACTYAWVRVEAWRDHLRLEVGDDGKGLSGARRGGFGLESMRERARLAGGTAKIFERAGAGPRVVVTLPMTEMQT